MKVVRLQPKLIKKLFRTRKKGGRFKLQYFCIHIMISIYVQLIQKRLSFSTLNVKPC